MSRILVAIAFAFLTLTPLAAQNQDEELTRLETHLEKIRVEYESGRVIGGVSWIGTGVAVGLAGTAFSYAYWGGSFSPTMNTARDQAVLLSWGYGGMFVIVGGLILALKSDYESMPEQFSGLPTSSPEEVQRKIVRGKVTLQSLADKAQFDRFLSAGILALGGASSIASAMATQASYSRYLSDTPTPSLLSDPSFTAGVIYLGGALLRAIFESTPEVENHSYLRWRDSVVEGSASN